MNLRLPSLRRPGNDDFHTFLSEKGHSEKFIEQFPTPVSQQQQQCFSAHFSRNAQQDTILYSSSGNQYRFVDMIKRTIFGQVVRAELMVQSSSLSSSPCSSLFPSPSNYQLRQRRDREDSISTHTSDETNLSMDDHDFLHEDEPSPFQVRKEEKLMVAIKIYSRARIHAPSNKDCKEDPSTELEISQFLSHHYPHLLGAIECCGNEEYMFNIMPFVPYPELFDHLEHSQRFSEEAVKNVARQVLSGLHVLHSHNIAHRDISLENILYDPFTQHSVLIDFGLSVITRRDAEDNITSSSSSSFGTSSSATAKQTLVPNIFTGKVNYLPPEILAGQPLINPYAADIWATGICLLYLLLGFPPLVQAHQSDVRFVFLKQGRLAELIAQWQVPISKETLDFITSLLAVEPGARPSVQEIMAHPWLR